MIVETFACDICGVRKGETNHWLSGSNVFNKIVFRPLVIDGDDSGLKHFCGKNCAIVFLSQELDKLNG